MKRPATKTMVIGHPAIAGPMMLAGGVTLLAAFQTSNAFIAILAVAMLATVYKANEQASAYRAWKADWDAMAGTPLPRTNTLSRFIGAALIAALILFGVGARVSVGWGVGYAVGWLGAHPILLLAPGLVVLGVLVQYIRHYPRRPKPAEPVKVVASTILPVPTLQHAFAALPDHCKRLA